MIVALIGPFTLVNYMGCYKFPEKCNIITPSWGNLDQTRNVYFDLHSNFWKTKITLTTFSFLIDDR